MKHGSLFSGIGGFDLASQWMGWENVFHCEIESFPRKILHHYWPNAISYEDIKKTDFTIHKGGIDIITGGFPCQPYSMAGKRKGKEDERHLWPEMLRAIREIQPRWVVGENVFGLINWNGGLVFDEVQSDLEAEGYEVQAYVLPAAAVNAPHRRDRVWFVAQNTMHSRCLYGRIEQERTEVWQQRNTCARDSIRICLSKGNATNSNDNEQNKCDSQHEINTSQGGINALGNIEQVGEYATDSDSWRLERAKESGWDSINVERKSDIRNATNTDSIGQEYALENRELERQRFGKSYERNVWDSFPTQSPICGGNDGIPDRLDNITFPKWRNESIKGYGNAIVPQVVYQIFKAIEEYESL